MRDRAAKYDELIELSVKARISGEYDYANLLSECARAVLMEREAEVASLIRFTLMTRRP
jgi:hypothetical protein